MQQLAHVAHGNRKFKCRGCGSVRMQKAKVKKQRKRGRFGDEG
jgi:transcription elongation factor Elf1